MECLAVDKLPTRASWIYEVKLDGAVPGHCRYCSKRRDW
jgi:hypothetical protein